MGIDLSLVIPAYNEERRLPGSLRRVLAYLEQQRLSYELIVVDDGSRDGTRDLVAAFAREDPHVRLVQYGGNRGKGYAVRRGMLEAGGARVLMSDADLSTPIEEYEKLALALERGAEIAIGSRALPDSNLAVRQPFLREMLGRTFNAVVRLLAVPGIHDTQCGFKLFTQEAARDVFSVLTVDRWCFDVEALLVARKMGYQIAEIPVTWIDEPNTKVNVLRDLARTGIDLARIRAYWLMRRPRRSTPIRKAAEPAGSTHR
ncbi:MAG: glycosyltransferase family 2 protein [Fimbriimonas ginsengisoli]|nr:glycosyltransferase family 2 protein [Fimbriimonas ginsengisoli]